MNIYGNLLTFMSYANICQVCCISHANNSFNPPKDAHKYYHHSHWTVGGEKGSWAK